MELCLNISSKLSFLLNVKEEIKEYIESVINDISVKGFLHPSITQIWLTDQYEDMIVKKSKELGPEMHTVSARSYVGAAKILFNRDMSNPEHILILDVNLLNDIDFKFMIVYQLISVYYKFNLPSELHNHFIIYMDSTFDDVIKYLCNDWFIAVLSCNWLKENGYSRSTDPGSIYDEFLKKVRNSHYMYQSDNNELKLWISIVNEIDFLVTQFILAKINEAHISSWGEYESVLCEIYNAIHLEIESEIITFDLKKFKQMIDNVLKKCYIRVDEYKPDGTPYKKGLYIHVINNPKLYQRGNIKETELSIVAFIDILGFKSIVEEFENNAKSNSLLNLHNALTMAIDVLKQNTSINPLHSKVIDYKMFSDCLCISIPIFDNSHDFLSELHSMLLVLASYQFLMLLNGFLVRGGVSLGSYYSDDKMIFSQGLIKAYELESKSAKNPLIQIDPSIVEKMLSLKKHGTDISNMKELLIFEKCEPDKIFVNFLTNFDYTKNIHSILTNLANDFPKELGSDLYKIVNLCFNKLQSLFPSDMEQVTNKSISDVRETVKAKSSKLISNNKVKSKYVWLESLLDWYEKKNTQFERLLNANN